MAEKAPPPDSPPQLSEIEDVSREFQVLAKTVSDKLDAFQAWFQSLPGKLEVSVSLPETANRHHHLALERVKDGWELLFSSAYDESRYPVAKASLANKCIIVSMLPKLLKELYEEQREAVAQLRMATDVLSKLPSAKGGK